MGALVAEPQDNMFSKKIFWLGSALLLIGVQAQSHQMMEHAQAAECCQEKTVGGVSYSLLPEAFHGSLPHQCLTSCVYTKTGMLSSPKFCFARGDLATECRDPPPPTEGPGSANINVAVHVIVKSATTGYPVANASVNFRTTTADMDYMDDTSYTNGEGVASFSVSRAFVGETASISVSREGYILETIGRTISNEARQIFQGIFIAPTLNEGELRLVLGWETTQDLDLWVEQINKATGDLVCDLYWINKTRCDGVILDVDSYDFGPETVTWGDAANDPYMYKIYVNDYDDEGENYDNDDVEGLGPSGAKVTLFGETNIKMEAEAGHSGSWWVIGTFSPSQGTSSFSMANIYARGAPGRMGSLVEAAKKERE